MSHAKGSPDAPTQEGFIYLAQPCVRREERGFTQLQLLPNFPEEGCYLAYLLFWYKVSPLPTPRGDTPECMVKN